MKNRDIEVEIEEVVELSRKEDSVQPIIRMHKGVKMLCLESIARRYAWLWRQGSP